MQTSSGCTAALEREICTFEGSKEEGTCRQGDDRDSASLVNCSLVDEAGYSNSRTAYRLIAIPNIQCLGLIPHHKSVIAHVFFSIKSLRLSPLRVPISQGFVGLSFGYFEVGSPKPHATFWLIIYTKPVCAKTLSSCDAPFVTTSDFEERR